MGQEALNRVRDPRVQAGLTRVVLPESFLPFWFSRPTRWSVLPQESRGIPPDSHQAPEVLPTADLGEGWWWCSLPLPTF